MIHEMRPELQTSIERGFQSHAMVILLPAQPSCEEPAASCAGEGATGGSMPLMHAIVMLVHHLSSSNSSPGHEHILDDWPEIQVLGQLILLSVLANLSF